MSEPKATENSPKGGVSPLFLGFLVVGVFLVAVFFMIMITQRDISETAAPAALSTAGAEGKALYLSTGNCNGCHPKEGRAAGIGPRLSTTGVTDETMFRYIRNGRRAMPANTVLTDEQINKIIVYVRELKPK
jgi:mono/diheme cytochrome c family protein